MPRDGRRQWKIDLLLRHAVTGDLPVLQDLFRRSSLSNDDDRPILLRHPEALRFTETALLRGRCRVAVTGGAMVVGFATTVAAGDRLELEDLFVAPEWMRRGVGRALIDDAVAHAQASGIDRIEVDGNPHALEFYAAAGFVVDAEIRTELGTGYRLHLDVPT